MRNPGLPCLDTVGMVKSTLHYCDHFFDSTLSSVMIYCITRINWLIRLIKSILAHLVYQPKSPIQSCFFRWHWHHPASASVLVLSVHTSPWHMVTHRSFIFGTPMHIYSPYMHIKYLAILTGSF